MALVFLHVVLVTLLNALTVQKLTFLYKEVLHLSATDVTTLSLLINLPAYLQPLMGVGSDLFPLFGFHRRSYFLLAVALHLLGYAGLGYLHQYHYVAVACLLILKGAGAVLSVVLVNAAMVAVGNETGVFGRLQSVNQFVPLVMALLFGSHLSGWVCQSWTYLQTFLVAALVVILRRRSSCCWRSRPAPVSACAAIRWLALRRGSTLRRRCAGRRAPRDCGPSPATSST